MVKYILRTILICLIWLPLEAVASPLTITLKGVVFDSQDKSPLPFATIKLKTDKSPFVGTITNEKGEFTFEKLTADTYELIISYIGYEEKKASVVVKEGMAPVFIFLKPSSLSLKEVVVTASESKDITSASKIDRTAMEHLQPTSFTDLLALLPGGSTKTPNMSTPNIIKLREVGVSSSDYNTSSLGTQFVVDGTPINTDAQMQYVKTEITSGFDDKTTINAGVDMRAISTDNIESVEIIRGIPSVEYGDLTSGLVIIKRRQSATPIEGRFKADQYSKLVSLGKGLEWGEKNLALTVDGGFLDSQHDPRNSMENYKRINFSTRLQKKWFVKNGFQLTWNTSADYAGNIDEEKNDPEIQTQPVDKFKSSYHSIQLKNKLKWQAPMNKMFKYAELNLSASYSKDEIKRSRFVQLDRDRTAPTNMEAGVHDAAILPYKYDAYLTVDGQPLNIFADLKAFFQAKTGIVNHRFFAGTSFTFAKNIGDGQQYDLSRPLNPLSSYSRPRKYSDIPASKQLSFFAQNNMKMSLGEHRFELQAGVRTNMLLGLESSYRMQGKIYFDPRFNAQWKFPGISLGDKELNIGLAGGIGWLTKMPTLLQLYPDKIYNDFMQLNYWNKNPEYKRVNLKTFIEDPTNYNLKPARNFKWEARLNFEYDHNDLSVTYFREKMNSGFRSMAFYQPYEFRKYDASGIDDNALTAPPALENLPYEDKKILDGYGYVGNGSQTLKEGIEFQFASKRFDIVNSRLTINGAWFKTTYENSEPIYRAVSKVINNVAIGDRYVGLYENEDRYIREQFNTNFIIDTWLSKIGVKLSETVECTWFRSRQNGMVNGAPLAYMDVNGQVNPFTEADKEDIYLKHLVQLYNPTYFDKDKTPFYLYVNFKATKDFGKHLSISLFADRILDYVPDYERNGLHVRRTALNPYFGMEMNIKL